MTITESAPASESKSFFGHPRGLMTLFLTEMWERFSFYGMRALLALYLITPPDGVSPPGPGLGLDDGSATAIYGSYLALVYVFPLIGGWIADRMWGARRTVLWGGIVITIAHFVTLFRSSHCSACHASFLLVITSYLLINPIF